MTRLQDYQPYSKTYSEDNMLSKILNHFRLTFHLLRDNRVSLWLKVFLIFIPVGYALIPIGIEIPDFTPVVGLLDDMALLIIATLIFNAVCPHAIVQAHTNAIKGVSSDADVEIEKFRHPNELRDLGLGLIMTIAVLLIGGYSAGLFLVLFLAVGFLSTKLSQASLMANSIRCTASQFPEIWKAYETAQSFLPSVKTNLFVTQNPVMNAYTFGLAEPFNIVLTSALVEKSTPEEIQAVIGHELGHIYFHHVLLTNLVGKNSIFEQLLFFKWSRSAEYSADAISVLASNNNPKPMMSALLKLTSGLTNASANLDEFLAQSAQVDNKKLVDALEMFSTHPFVTKRIVRIYETFRVGEVDPTGPTELIVKCAQAKKTVSK